MPLVSISHAAKLAGITRQHLHTHYINTGKISVDRSLHNKPQIDTSELIRVFGELRFVDSDFTDTSLHHITPEQNSKIDHLEREVTALRQLLSESRDRETWYQTQIDNAQQLLQIEHKRRNSWLSRILGRG